MRDSLGASAFITHEQRFPGLESHFDIKVELLRLGHEIGRELHLCDVVHGLLLHRNVLVGDFEGFGRRVDLPLGVADNHGKIILRGTHACDVGDSRRGREIECIEIRIFHIENHRFDVDELASVILDLIFQFDGRSGSGLISPIVGTGSKTSGSEQNRPCQET